MLLSVFGTLFGIALFLILFLNLLGLPANWLIVIIFGFMSLIPGNSFDFFNFIPVVALAIAAEFLESYLQVLCSKKSGASTAGNIGGFIGSIVGAILGIPFLLGLGALFGALGGAWLGCFIVEKIRNTPSQQAMSSAWGAVRGRFLGFCVKIGFGACIIVYGMHAMELDIPKEELMNQESTTQVLYKV